MRDQPEGLTAGEHVRLTMGSTWGSQKALTRLRGFNREAELQIHRAETRWLYTFPLPCTATPGVQEGGEQITEQGAL